jgi:ferrous iron transport protein A
MTCIIFGANFVIYARFLRIFAAMNLTGEKLVRLSELATGQKAVIHEHEQTDFRLTLMEMGCIPGEPVSIQMIAPLGDPMAIQIAGYYLSIRKKDADNIWVSTKG